LPLVVFGKKVKFNSEEKGRAVLIIANKEVFIGKVTRQNIVSNLGCFPLLYPL
jgi:hypothetical protein